MRNSVTSCRSAVPLNQVVNPALSLFKITAILPMVGSSQQSRHRGQGCLRKNPGTDPRCPARVRGAIANQTASPGEFFPEESQRLALWTTCGQRRRGVRRPGSLLWGGICLQAADRRRGCVCVVESARESVCTELAKWDQPRGIPVSNFSYFSIALTFFKLKNWAKKSTVNFIPTDDLNCNVY